MQSFIGRNCKVRMRNDSFDLKGLLAVFAMVHVVVVQVQGVVRGI